MADDNEKNVPKSIQDHQPRQTLEMKTPGGNALRKAGAEKQLHQEHSAYNSARAARHVKKDKDIASKEQVREGTKGILGREHESAKERER